MKNNRINNGIYPDAGPAQVVSPTTSFDLIFWIIKISKYWYLLLLALVIGFGLAYLKNKAWKPLYKTSTTILMEENRKDGFVSNFGYSSQGIRNMNNQMIILSSNDLISQAVNTLNVTTNVYQQGKFKKIDLYKNGPVDIHSSYVARNAYGKDFQIEGMDSTYYKISYPAPDKKSKHEIFGKYGEFLENELFFILVEKTNLFTEIYHLHFNFITPAQQITNYASRLSFRNIMDGSSVIEISLVGEQGERDADFLTYLINHFFTDNLMRKNISSRKTIDFINEQLVIIRDSIISSESKLNTYQARTGIYTQDKTARNTNELEELDKQRSDLRLRKTYLSSLTDYLKQNNEILVTPSTMGVQNPQLAVLVTRYNELSFNMKTLKPENPIYKRYSMELMDTKKLLDEAIRALESSMTIEENNLNEKYSRRLGEIASLPVKERELLAHERDFKINDTYNTYLLQRRIESQIQMASNAADNLILDRPRIVSVVNSKDIKNTYVFYIVLAFIIVIIYIVARELIFNFTVQSRDEVEKIAGLPILGTIPHSNKKIPVVVKNYPKSAFSESFRNLRSRMEYVVQKESNISMLISSTEPQDGKTFIAANLASIYQLTGKKTLLIDFDLRRPLLSKSMDLGHRRGISNYLIGQVDLHDVIVTHPEYKFDILPAGTIPPNPSELLRSDKTKKMLEELKQQYDYIIMDCSPAGLVSDAYFLSRYIDVLLYVVRNDKTNKSFFRHTIQELKDDDVSNMVIVYNDVNLTSGYSGYGNRKYYGRSSYYMKHASYYHEEKNDIENS